MFVVGELALTSVDIEDLPGLAEGDEAVLRWKPFLKESLMSAAFLRALTGIQELEMFRFSSRSILEYIGLNWDIKVNVDNY